MQVISDVFNHYVSLCKSSQPLIEKYCLKKSPKM